MRRIVDTALVNGADKPEPKHVVFDEVNEFAAPDMSHLPEADIH